MVYDLLNLGEAHAHLGQPEAALEYNKQALELAEQLGHLEGQGNLWQNMGLFHASRGDKLVALACFLKALAIRETIGNEQEKEETRGQIASIRTALEPPEWYKLFAEAERLTADPDWRPWTLDRKA